MKTRQQTRGFAMRWIFVGLALFAFTVMARPVAAQNTGATIAGAVFDGVERRVIMEYFGKKGAKAKSDDDDDDDDDDKGRGKGKKNKKGKGDKHKERKGKGAHGKSGQLPPGLARMKKLPPGLARKLEKDGSLPPGLADRDLPEDLASRLPPTKKGLKRVIVDESIVLIEEATGRVLDVLGDVLKGRR